LFDEVLRVVGGLVPEFVDEADLFGADLLFYIFRPKRKLPQKQHIHYDANRPHITRRLVRARLTFPKEYFRCHVHGRAYEKLFFGVVGMVAFSQTEIYDLENTCIFIN
jgi:hypothetical protein